MRSCQLSAISFQLRAVGVCLAIPFGLTGCGPPKNVAITTKPSTEELPTIPQVEHISQATVAVEGGPMPTEFRLVPEFKPPELTAEEKAALGPAAVHFKFLLYNELSLPLNSTVGPWQGGIATAVDQPSRVAGLFDRQRPLTGVAGWGGATTFVDVYPSRVAGTYSPHAASALAGPRSGIVVGTDPLPSRVARREPRKTP